MRGNAATMPDRPRIPVVARVIWAHAGKELLEGGRATRWSGRSVFVTPEGVRCKNRTGVVWLDATDVRRAWANGISTPAPIRRVNRRTSADRRVDG
jgi:hypothetical protein